MLRVGIYFVATLWILPSCRGRTDGENASQPRGLEAGEFRTFATTFAPNPRYACGYLKEQVDPMIAADERYFAAISAASYDPKLCGRLIEIDIKAQCGDGSAIDEGYCQPEAIRIDKTIEAVIVDRCPDAKKCMPPSRENRALDHNVTVHIDLGPQDKAASLLGPKLNYDIAWRFSRKTYETQAYIVGTASNQDYIRIGFMSPRGTSSLEVAGATWSHNSLQAEFGGYFPGIRDRLRKGLEVILTHSDNTQTHFQITSDFAELGKHLEETIYRATLTEK